MKSFLCPTTQLNDGTIILHVDSTRTCPITKEMTELIENAKNGAEVTFESIMNAYKPLLQAMKDW